MSFADEHRKLKPVLDAAWKLDIAANPDPEAIFEVGSGGFAVWATREHHPDDQYWKRVLDKMIAGAFSKPCAYLADVCWKWEDEKIVGLVISTTSYILKDELYAEFPGDRFVSNRPVDLEYAEEVVAGLFEQAGVPLLPFYWGEDDSRSHARWQRSDK